MTIVKRGPGRPKKGTEPLGADGRPLTRYIRQPARGRDFSSKNRVKWTGIGLDNWGRVLAITVKGRDAEEAISDMMLDARLGVAICVLPGVVGEEMVLADEKGRMPVVLGAPKDKDEDDYEPECTCDDRSWYGDEHDSACEMQGQRWPDHDCSNLPAGESCDICDPQAWPNL